MQSFVYASLLLLTLLVPLARSFEPRIHFVSYWKILFKAIAPIALFFIVWDVFFTAKHIWGFNETYVLGFNFYGLPLEEIAFFWVVPFACVFIYEVLNYFVKKDLLQKFAPAITIMLLIVSGVIAFRYATKLYTFLSFAISFFLLCLQILWIKPAYLGRFYLAFMVILVPFLAINGVLTALPVVWYNPAAIIGVKIGTIPFEDVFYCLDLLLPIVNLYEYQKKKTNISVP
ncbi:MAG: lycopene cyclase domain-containing protein [Chitinophagales bacterium]|nr:lycopene cyclase domain-containing protein [Bacteroidota bacterium]MCB9043235.1 lycopene cyclase domain-containing protein [Chitinophagales bacterium]